MKKKFIIWLVTIVALCLPGFTYADVLCNLNDVNGPSNTSYSAPNNLYVSSTAAIGTVLWKSDEITINVFCRQISPRNYDRVIFWVNPYNYTVGQGVDIAIIISGKTFQTGTTPSASGSAVVDYTGSNFQLTYSIALIKKGTSPVSGSVDMGTFPVFVLKGATEDANGAVNVLGFRQFLRGTINFSAGGTCSLASGDVRKSVALAAVTPATLATIGSVAGQQAFTLSVTNCSAGTNTAQFTFTGTPDSNNPFAFANNGTAKGVAINLGSSDDGSTIRANGTSNLKIASIQNGSGVLKLFAQYIATAAVQNGTVNSDVTVNITYQ
jgi:type 1 fimbria pilin